jgi:hypothetical protein
VRGISMVLGVRGLMNLITTVNHFKNKEDLNIVSFEKTVLFKLLRIV